MKNICIVMEKHVSAHAGGAELQADLLARELSSREGVQTYYLTRTVPTPEVAASYPYQILRIGSGVGNFRKRAVFFDALELWSALKEIAPAVIYQRMKQSYTGICSHYAQKTGIPLFFHAALDTDLSPSRRRDRALANLPFDVVDTLLANHGVRTATRIVVQTGRQAGLANSGFGRSDALVIPNFQPLPMKLPEKPVGRICVLWVANIHSNKQPHYFLELASRFVDRKDIEFVMIGRPNDNWPYKRGMAEIHEARNVSYLGKLTMDEVNLWMERADVFVNTSALEGFPNTFIQAWARGAVVVSLEVDVDGGLEKQGIGYRCGSMDKLAEVVGNLAGSVSLRRKIQLRAFDHVQQHHSMRNARILVDLIVSSDPRARSPENRKMNDPALPSDSIPTEW